MERLLVISALLLAVLGSIVCFEPGQTYKYSYLTTVTIDKPATDNISLSRNSVRLTAVVEISALWDREGDYVRKLKVLSASVMYGSGDSMVPTKQLTKFPVYFSQRLGGNIIIYRFLDDTTESVNIKQGIINLLLYQTQPGTIKESDISGDCDATYGRSGHLVTKVKTNCRPRHLTGQFTNPHEFWQLNTTSTYSLEYDIDDMQVLKSASCEETHLARMEVNQRTGAAVQQRQELRLLGQSVGERMVGADIQACVKAISQETGGLVSSLLSSEPETVYRPVKKTQVAAVVAEHREDLYKDNAALPEASRAFLSLVSVLRHTNKLAILDILNDPENYYLVESLVDACVAADTKDSHEALLDFLVFDDVTEHLLPERYLLAMAFSTHPRQRNINRLKQLLSTGLANPKVRTSTLLALGAVLNTFSKQKLDRYNMPFLTESQNWLLEQLNACQDDQCKIMHLGALRNAALPGALPTVLYYAEHAEVGAINVAALEALAGYDRERLTQEAKPTLLRILNELEQSMPLPVRVSAAEWLLATYLTNRELRDVIRVARTLPSNESTAYVIKRVLDRAQTDEYYRKLLSDLRSDKSLFNYDLLAVPGSSNALTNSFITSRDVTSTYSLFTENTASGLLRRSVNDMRALTANNHVLPMVQVGIYADGMDSMSSYFGSSDSEETSTREPSAGLKLSLFGVGLRPIQFFSSQGEMMSALWSAPSEPTSALQTNVLLHDHSQQLSLGNGLSVSLQARSSLSLDLSGAMTVSLWNRRAESFVRNSGSFSVVGEAHLGSALFQLGLNFTADSAVEVHFTSDVSFYDMPISMCMQMTMPEYETSVRTTRYSSIPDQAPRSRVTSSNLITQGRSFLLDPRNTRQCNHMQLNDS